ncbi:Uncharacterised protein [Serratia marcescens]|uniref:Uncharacterized protein n=1 Tax=Serratia marcescens TaxID=615 RepID=A0A379YAG0_SERMA|nr:Uncharacterised protein [Serratia marcescens]
MVLLQYYLGMLGLCCLGAAAAWAAGMTGIATGALLLGGAVGGALFSNRAAFYLYVAYFRTRRRVFYQTPLAEGRSAQHPINRQNGKTYDATFLRL